MADGYEPYHVPQQSRRDKLRVNAAHGHGDSLQACAAFVGHLYDPSLISSDLINCANLRAQNFNLGGNTNTGVKEEGMNLMNFGGGINSSTHMYVDPQLSVQLNPSPIHEMTVYPAAAAHCYRGVAADQSFHGNEVALSMAATAAAQHHHHHQDNNSNNNSNTTGQSLSLSLSSHHTSLPLELNLQRYNNNESPMFSNHKVSSVPLGPFTGYASVLKGSRFLKPAQQLLEELCGVGRGFYGEKTTSDDDSSLLDPPPLETSLNVNGVVDGSMNCSDANDHTRKKSRLLSMLDEVYKRYKQYYQQMQAAVAAFESVAGLSSAAPFANLALKAMSKHFTCLKNAITDQLRFITKPHGKTNSERNDALRLENPGRGTYSQRPFHAVGFNDQPVWRPQRGLPERAVAVLRAWLFEHFLHPYPTDTDKIMLAKQTGLSRNQVSNWFINARVRLWKPMVEEIHMLEMRETQKSSQRGDQHPPNRQNDHLPTSCSIDSENASSSIHRMGDIPNLKRTHDDHPTDHETRGGSDHTQMKLPYDNLLHGQHMAGMGLACTGTGNVSLTLGLHQNGIGLPDSYPINAARRFGLDSQGGGGGEGYIMSRFAAENQQFGRDHISGHLMHDFVG